ncbi:uncharacterized protein LOC135825069 [Sycon ciliatum]|uniref:uncharacterized protein LOC135825069 n=1 Tax=Sycon ciliatum TaxID=27933 RepID=UPI0031F672DC
MNVRVWQVTLSVVLAGILVATAVRASSGNDCCTAIVRGLHGFVCALWFGTAAWGAIFQGVLMLEILPRHHFGNLQSQVIPIMFQFGNICMGLAIATFLHQHPVATLNGEEMVQLIVLAVSLVTSMLNNVWFLPNGTRIMRVCHKMEKEVGEGHAIRFLDMKKFEGNAKYTALRKEFDFYHVGTQLTGVISCACVAYRMAYICSRYAI